MIFTWAWSWGFCIYKIVTDKRRPVFGLSRRVSSIFWTLKRSGKRIRLSGFYLFHGNLVISSASKKQLRLLDDRYSQNGFRFCLRRWFWMQLCVGNNWTLYRYGGRKYGIWLRYSFRALEGPLKWTVLTKLKEYLSAWNKGFFAIMICPVGVSCSDSVWKISNRKKVGKFGKKKKRISCKRSEKVQRIFFPKKF